MAEASHRHVACPHCGKHYRWKPDLAGRKVVCKCGQKMRLPQSADGRIEPIGPPPPPADPNEASTYDLEVPLDPPGGSTSTGGVAASENAPSAAEPTEPAKCPSCNQPLKPTAVLCVKCGYNRESGQQLQTDVAAVVEVEEEAAPADADAPADTPADLEAMGGTSAASRALEDRADEARPDPVIELYLPLGLIVLGLAIRFLQAMFFGDEDTAGFLTAVAITLIELAVALPLLVGGLLVAVKVLGVSFGPLGPALFKLLAIYLGPAALGTIAYHVVTPLTASAFLGVVAGFFVVVGTMWALLSRLFNLESMEAFYVLIILFVVYLAAMLFMGVVVLSMLFV